MNIFHLSAVPWRSSLTAREFLRGNAWLMLWGLVPGALLAVCGYLAFNEFEAFADMEAFFGLISTNLGLFGAIVAGAVVVVWFYLMLAWYSLKLVILRIQNFGMSGWWALGYVVVLFGIDSVGFPLNFLLILSISVLTVLLYFHETKRAPRYAAVTLPNPNSSGVEAVLVWCFSLATWFTLMSDPLFNLIDNLY